MNKQQKPMLKEEIKNKIYTIRGLQVMLDKDLAQLYGVGTKVFNQAVKRNSERFPKDFMFQITSEENKFLRSQIVTLKKGRGRHRKYLPYVFTEQGVSMLSAVLSSKTAIEVSIQIINAFVAMRRFINENARIFQRLSEVERKQLAQEIKTDKKFQQVFDAIESKSIEPRQGIFFNGQIFDGYIFVTKLIRKAKKSILLIDNYIDETVLTMLAKRKKKVKVKILTGNVSRQLKLDVSKHKEQYPGVEIKAFKKSHDRFIVLDNTEIYHLGASLKDLGKKWFAFSKMDDEVGEIMQKIRRETL